MRLPDQNPLILIAEDNPDQVFLLTEALAEAGLTHVIHACNGVECITRLGIAQNSLNLQQPFPDLLLLDIHMPRMDGLEVMKRIHEASLKLPVLVMSTSAEHHDVESMRRMGAQGYVRKPSSFDGYVRFAWQLGSWWQQGAPLPNDHM
jgi:CheY-like chemotaxis protein